LPGAVGRCGGHHRSIHRCDHWVAVEPVENPEVIGGNPDPGPRLQSLFHKRFDHLASLSQELAERRVVPVGLACG